MSSAYSVEFEVPTSATVPGRVTVTGDFSMSKLPLAPPKNDPQCWTVDVVSRLAIAAEDGRPAEWPGDSEQPAEASTTAIAAAHSPIPAGSVFVVFLVFVAAAGNVPARDVPGVSGTQ